MSLSGCASSQRNVKSKPWTWSEAESACSHPGLAIECADMCSRETRAGRRPATTCEVYAVLKFEKGKVPERQAEMLRELVMNACGRGIERACRALKKPESSPPKKSVSSSAGVAGGAHERGVGRDTDEDPEPTNVYADARGCGCKPDDLMCAMKCPKSRRPTRAARASQQRKDEEAFKRASAVCEQDPKTCEGACDGDKPASYSCVALATALYFSQGATPQDMKRARNLDAVACAGGNQFGCSGVRVMDEHAARKTKAERRKKERAQAERDLPGLFAKCNQYGLRRVRLLRTRDRDGLMKLQPKWAANIDQLRDAIDVLTNNEGPRYRTLLMKFKRCTRAR
ncbi:hypothetical protein JYT22_01350 [Endomicrobium sp. AH-315-J14]|nr:hypothetical protein [Endomicrobium sp. AH-315-J14]